MTRAHDTSCVQRREETARFVNRRLGYSINSENVRQRSLWHHMHHRHLRGRVLRRLRRDTMDRVAHYARQVSVYIPCNVYLYILYSAVRPHLLFFLVSKARN